MSSHWCKKVPSDILVKFGFSLFLITGWCPLHCLKKTWNLRFILSNVCWCKHWNSFLHLCKKVPSSMLFMQKRYQVTNGSFLHKLKSAYEVFYSCNKGPFVNGNFLHELFILNEGFVTPVNVFTWYLYVCIAYTVSNTHFLF